MAAARRRGGAALALCVAVAVACCALARAADAPPPEGAVADSLVARGLLLEKGLTYQTVLQVLIRVCSVRALSRKA
jgi:hypothetical protein